MNMYRGRRSLLPLIHLCARHGGLEDPISQDLLQAALLDPEDAEVVAELHRRAVRGMVRSATGRRCPFQNPPPASGDILWGRARDGEPIRGRLAHLSHALVVGSTKAGKTNLAKFLALQIVPRVPGAWLTDFRKAEWRGLLPRLASAGAAPAILDGRDLKWNPLQVEDGVDPRVWASIIADMLVEVLRLPARAAALVHTALYDLYDRTGILNGGRDYPVLRELCDQIRNTPDANAQSRAAILDRLAPVLRSLGPVLEYRRGWPATVLARHRLIFELGGLAHTDQTLIVNGLVHAVFVARIAQGASNRPVDLWICTDEAGRLCLGGADGGRGPMADAMSLVRGAGVNVWLSAQSAEGLDNAVTSNAPTKLLGMAGSMGDYRTIGGAMGLTAEQIRWAQHNLRPGRFILQFGDGQWRRPILCRVPLVRHGPDTSRQPGAPILLPATTAQADIGDLPDTLASFPVKRASPESAANVGPGRHPARPDSPNGVRANGHLKPPATPKTSTPPTDPASPTTNAPSAGAPQAPPLDSRAGRLLRAIIDHPLLPSSRYPRLVAMSTKTVAVLRKELAARGLIRERTVNLSPRGRSCIVLEPLPPARDALRDLPDGNGRP